MNDLQTKFAITLVALGIFFTYAFPASKQTKHNHDAVARQVGQVYIAPNPHDSNAPSGNVSLDGDHK